ncbi:MAG: homocysteine S-methyltransferase family protein [Calditrichae bacterium]|nr:homocysteine S-methyltransferase family protein [Calditrichota bacterium]MCB9058385.1 homocysteine S-methyltransferase family protein [Calditrichia bacterium]
METILSRLNSEILISDGAMGTELQKQTLPNGFCAEELNDSHPEIIRSIYKSYYDAGSDIITTNSFGGSRIALHRHGLENRVSELNGMAVQLAREICPPGHFVAGSIGPTGDILEPLGTLTLDEAGKAFEEQALALADAGADIIFIETMMSLEELECAVKAVKKSTRLPVSASMTFNAGPAGIHTQWGVNIAGFVKSAQEAGADIIASNCGKGFDEMIQVVKEMRPLTSLPIMAQANAGLPELIDGKQVYTETAENIIPKVKQLLDLGVNIIGGCCGTGPSHIAAIHKLLRGK